MSILTKVNEKFYSYFDKETKMLFTLKYGDRGVYGYGKAFYLTVTYDGAKQVIATFTTKDDGYRCYEEDYRGIVWNAYNVLKEANEMVCRMLGKEKE